MCLSKRRPSILSALSQSIKCWLQHTATHCNMRCHTLQHPAMWCHTLQHHAMRCNTALCAATHYNTLHNTAPHLQHTTTHCTTPHHTCNTLPHTAKYCKPLLVCLSKKKKKKSPRFWQRIPALYGAVCVCVHCSVLKYFAACCSWHLLGALLLLHSIQQFVAVCCSVLLCVAVCCSTMRCVAIDTYFERSCCFISHSCVV